MDLILANRVIVVTGGSGLIGSHFVRAIADAGGQAVIADIDQCRGQALCEQLVSESSSRQVEFVHTDTTSARSVDELIETLLRQYGRVDGLVNNAYPRNNNYGRHLEDVTYEDFTENLGMHVGSYFLTTQRFLVPFRSSGRGGVVVNMGSVYGSIAPRFQIYAGTGMTMPVEYAAIKAAVIHLTRYLAQYVKGQGIRVNCISPGGIFDNQPDIFLDAYRAFAGDKGMLSANDLEGALLFLLSDCSRYINGQNIVVDDGWSL